jgi:S1-C subfamily serine protease
MFTRLKTLPLAVGLLLGLIIGSDPIAIHTPLPSKAPGVATAQGVSTATVDPIDLGWLSSAKESTVVVATPFGHGSGVVIDWVDGYAYVLTAKHVIAELPDGSEDITLVWASGDTDYQRTGTLVRRHACHDLALIKAVDVNRLMVPRRLAANYDWMVRSFYVLAIGYPESIFPASVTIGEIYQVGYTNEYYSCCQFVKHSAPIWFGNSGGPLFNYKGELIGINVMIGGYNGHAASDRGWAVSLEDIREFLGE